ncbi:DAD1 isoform 5 [Pan troglodytes]|uniref:Dolichyl-diphosphooligosaccharide--protein glycosyltransferase subunit DAD1 n=3 Tax=Hominidae TaxID=9604 RepID=F5GXX5_HUMAN|nr:defender against cell death 1 [Homo sapiens]KAI4059962.1 defender against cell death 1 [Homo sapiens]PNI96469.1 DAD1 isoform 5 [Pan troglodytes]PNJ35878.1 DAD1 isoform 2 [Pongo abelii]
MSASVVSVISRFLEEYLSSTPQRLKLLDAYLLYILLTGALQFVCLRIQINPQNKADFQGISPERAFADFLFASTILHLVVMNFVG